MKPTASKGGEWQSAARLRRTRSVADLLHHRGVGLLAALSLVLFTACGDPGGSGGSTPDSELRWVRTYGGSHGDSAVNVEQTADGGYAVLAQTRSTESGTGQIWFLRVDAGGSVVWQKAYGEPRWVQPVRLVGSPDGGYTVLGYVSSVSVPDPMLPPVWKGEELLLLKLDPDGHILWQKTYRGSETQPPAGRAIARTADDGYIVVGDQRRQGVENTDIWIMRLDMGGNVVWQRTFGSGFATSVRAAADGGAIVVADSPGDGHDALVMKLDAAGSVVWSKTYGGFAYDAATDVIAMPDGGYAVAGYTFSFGAGGADSWLLRLDARGEVLWQKTYGHGTGVEGISSVALTPDGGFVLACNVQMYGAVRQVAAVRRLDGSGNLIWQKVYDGGSATGISEVQPTAEGGFVAVGTTGLSRYETTPSNAWVIKLGADGSAGECAAIASSDAVARDVVGVAGTAAIAMTDIPTIVAGGVIAERGAALASSLQCGTQAPALGSVSPGSGY